MESPLGAPAFCGAGNVWHRFDVAAEASNLAVRGAAKTLRRGFVEVKSGYAMDTISRVRTLDNHYI
jgi:hypothetical protein